MREFKKKMNCINYEIKTLTSACVQHEKNVYRKKVNQNNNKQRARAKKSTQTMMNINESSVLINSRFKFKSIRATSISFSRR